MKRSINEIQGMVLKAARGAGVPLGVAEDLARAAPFFILNSALEDVSHLIESGAAQAQAAIDQIIAGEDVAPPQDIPATTLRCLAAAQGVTLVEQGGVLLSGEGAPIDPATGPHHVPDDLWARLEAWAAKTYVPASEASRIAGAGAGLTDND